MTPDNPLPHLQLRLLAAVCSDVHASQSHVLAHARRALEYGATAEQVELVAGHWPASSETTPGT